MTTWRPPPRWIWFLKLLWEHPFVRSFRSSRQSVMRQVSNARGLIGSPTRYVLHRSVGLCANLQRALPTKIFGAAWIHLAPNRTTSRINLWSKNGVVLKRQANPMHITLSEHVFFESVRAVPARRAEVAPQRYVLQRKLTQIKQTCYHLKARASLNDADQSKVWSGGTSGRNRAR